MRIVFTTDSKQNLCDTCPKCFAECRRTVLGFGDGVGDDNVIKCSGYTGKVGGNIKYGGVVPKLTEDVYMDAFLDDIHTGTEKANRPSKFFERN